MLPPELFPEYFVHLSRDDEQTVEPIVAVSRAMAVEIGEQRCPGWTADIVTTSRYFTVAGRCDRCGVALFTDQQLRHSRDGVRCIDCCSDRRCSKT